MPSPDVKSGSLTMEIRILRRKTALAAICLALPGCASTGLPSGDQAYEIIPAPSNQTAPSEYRIGPLDVLKITVFQEIGRASCRDRVCQYVYISEFAEA